MNIKILTKEKIQDKFNKEAIAEYSKRLTRYCKLDSKVLKNDEAILKNLTEKEYIIYISTKGNLISSEQLANKLNDFAINGKSNIIIIYSKIHNELLFKKVDETIAISKMNFDAGLTAVMLHEQIYRAYRIINKEPYHK